MNKILMIGCGHMGMSLLRAWSIKTQYSFIIVDPYKYKLINKDFKKKVKAFKQIDNIKSIKSIDVVIFAIKPQIANEVLEKFKNNSLSKKTIFVSIIAGKKINFFAKFLPFSHKFIRVMPNMPALINQGMSCLIGNKNISKQNKNKINSLFLKVGKTIWLKSENQINKVTAISGSGPGYVFLLIDAFEKAAAELGLGKKITNELVSQTFLGSINLFLKEKKSALELSNAIAVKGGTTEAGIKEFNKNNAINKIFTKVVKASYMRANKIGK